MTPGRNPESVKVLAKVEQLAMNNPLPEGLREQIGNWIEPVAMRCEVEHEAVMDCIEVAFPLIVAWMEARP
jgi:hypothetical protein